jgi:hypothetical protein
MRFVALTWLLFPIKHLHFEQHVVWCGYKNEIKKYKCLKEIGLHAQNISIILDSIFNILGEGGGGYMTI